MLTQMKRQTRGAESIIAQFAAFGMCRAERCAAIVAQGLCVAATLHAQLVLHTSHQNHSAQEIVHISRREYTSEICHDEEKLIKILGNRGTPSSSSPDGPHQPACTIF
jgi:hypothetical protein